MACFLRLGFLVGADDAGGRRGVGRKVDGNDLSLGAVEILGLKEATWCLLVSKSYRVEG